MWAVVVMAPPVSDERPSPPPTTRTRVLWSIVYVLLAGVQWLIGLGMSAAGKRAWPELYR